MKKIQAFLLLLISPMTINANNKPIWVCPDVNLREIEKRNIKQQTTEREDITLPDLDGNTLKLIKLLEINKFITIEEEDYKKIVNIYDKCFKIAKDESFSDNIYTPFKRVLNNITIGAKAGNQFLRLIGDEIADRGMNDCLTFLLFKRMKDIGIKYEIIYSNHADYFWGRYNESRPEKSFDGMGKCFESVNKKLQSYLSEQKKPYRNSGEAPKQFDHQFFQQFFQHSSLSTMVEVVRNNPEIKKEIVDIITTIYKPRIKLLSCSLSDNDITIFTHAPAGLAQIKKVAEKMKVDYRANSIEDLKNTIDRMNENFRNNFLGRVEIYELYETNGEFPFVWERNEDGKIKWQHKIDGKDIHYVHGHDSQMPKSINVYNLELDTSKLQGCKPVILSHNRIGKTVFVIERPKTSEDHCDYCPVKGFGYVYETEGPLAMYISPACITKTNKDGLKSSQKQYEETKGEETKEEETKKTTKQDEVSEEQEVKNNKDEDKYPTRKRDEKKQVKVEQQNKKNFRMSSQM